MRRKLSCGDSAVQDNILAELYESPADDGAAEETTFAELDENLQPQDQRDPRHELSVLLDRGHRSVRHVGSRIEWAPVARASSDPVRVLLEAEQETLQRQKKQISSDITLNGEPLTPRMADVCCRARAPKGAQAVPADRLTQVADDLSESRPSRKPWGLGLRKRYRG